MTFSPDFEEYIEQLRLLIGHNLVADFFKEIESCIHPKSSKRNELLVLKSNHERVKQEYISGRISWRKFDSGCAKINLGLLVLLDSMREEDFQFREQGSLPNDSISGGRRRTRTTISNRRQ